MKTTFDMARQSFLSTHMEILLERKENTSGFQVKEWLNNFWRNYGARQLCLGYALKFWVHYS